MAAKWKEGLCWNSETGEELPNCYCEDGGCGTKNTPPRMTEENKTLIKQIWPVLLACFIIAAIMVGYYLLFMVGGLRG